MSGVTASDALWRFNDTGNSGYISLIVETPAGTHVRRIPPAMPLAADKEPGIAAEEAAHTAAVTWGLPDFVFQSALTRKGSGQRELGDRLLLSGRRGAVIQVKSRTVKPKSDDEERAWIQKVTKKAMSQAKGTVRMLRLQPADMINGRGTTLSVAGTAYEWMAVSLLDHDQVPPDTVPTFESIGMPALTLTRRDWDFLFDQLRSTTAVLDYLFRVAAEPPIALGDESVRYYELAAADAAAPPREVDTELIGPGGRQFSTPLLPQAPAGAGETNAHLVIRIVLEDVATSMLRNGVSESDRLMVLADLDRLPVGIREEWGQLLLDMLDEVEKAPDGHLMWRSRRQLHDETDEDRQMLFTCATHFDKYVEAAFGNYVLLRHHQVGTRTGRPEALCSAGVMLTPNHSGARPWDTTLVKITGPSYLTPEEVCEFEKLWPESSCD
ncbi:hypothetical protein [Streptomyces flaveolus]|uniref:hypothetical protein n=1 Tax=Streptomyces flaveolus TaxID=67297 RepID=UPI00166F6A06|nr:hypothetical protein [Streptomyces flaveolus]GGQ96950.1 hypothetical protein GCM10010216_69210 [Streptomyces flaveolus]